MDNTNTFSDEAPVPEHNRSDFTRSQRIGHQWYRRDPERLSRELRSLSGRYDDIFVARMEDQNLVVVVGTPTAVLALVTPHDYPSSPPEAFDLSGQVSEFHKDGAADIDLSRRTGFTWYPSKSLRDAAMAAERALAIQPKRKV